LAGSEQLGIYVDDVYRVSDGPCSLITVDRAFLLFACKVGARFDGCLVFGRTLHSSQPADYVLPPEVGLVELPHYRDLFHLGEVLAAAPRTVAAMWRGLRRVDTVWVFGPQVFALVLVVLALLRRKRVVLGVRQNTMGYYRSRLPSRRWSPILGLIWTMDRFYRLLSRRLSITVVGPEVARQYGGARPSLLEMTVTLVGTADVVTRPTGRDWSSRVGLLTVGRVDKEKNPLLLLNVLGRLQERRPGRYELTWVGRGPLEQAVAKRVADLGLTGFVELRGYVPFGPELLDLYRGAHAFVHISRTEGVPQVLIEAMASGIPIVATAVGGVSSLLDDGAAGLLVSPDDEAALVEAILRLSDDARLRSRLAERGLRLVRQHTFEQEVSRVAGFVARSAQTGFP
jgi:glycosyltransferase involved in cell wall biosynthesis